MFRKSKLLRSYSDEELTKLALQGLVIEQDGYLYPTLSGAAVSAKWYTRGPLHLVNGDVDWDTSTNIMVSLMKNTYTPDQDAHEFWGGTGVSTEELATAGGYTAGGQALGSRAVAVDTASNETRLTGPVSSSWTSATFSAYFAIIWRSTGTNSTSPLLGYVDFGGVQAPSAGTFTITWDPTGILKITAS